MPVKLGASLEATVVIDDAGLVVSWNEPAERLLGRSAAEAVGKHCHEVMHGLTPAGAPLCGPDCAVMALCRQGNAPRRFEMVARRPDGSEVWLDVTTVTIEEDEHQLAVHVLSESVSAKRLAGVAAEVARRLTEAAPERSVDEAALAQINRALTPREVEVLRLLAAGIGTDDIAARLSLSRSTVRNHVQNILPKLGVHTRVEAVVLALKSGLVHLH
ncbi:MAG TPA: LuxR C-terminal-related transcriptional regulator [Candidatus Eremiobacteraceae bacterium]|nr:LuxR C-terminal-related transcriptional regulator [Candidatus Eremiobacteraceae bacterium]